MISNEISEGMENIKESVGACGGYYLAVSPLEASDSVWERLTGDFSSYMRAGFRLLLQPGRQIKKGEKKGRRIKNIPVHVFSDHPLAVYARVL